MLQCVRELDGRSSSEDNSHMVPSLKVGDTFADLLHNTCRIPPEDVRVVLE